jgi:hypothetical protein
MSIFKPTTVACPACQKPVEFEAVHSVNADRRSDLRAAILARSFQRGTCGNCAVSFRLDPEFVYLDVGRGQWIAAYPLDRMGDWEAAQSEAQAAFDRSFGAEAGEPAKEVGDGLKPRITFGWAALREKIVAVENDLDDVALELLKIALLRSQPESPLANDTELRLIHVKPDELLLAWLNSREESVVEALGVPLTAYQEVAADPESWEAVSKQLDSGLFIDMQKLMLATDA